LKENTRELSIILPELKRLAHEVSNRAADQGLDFTSVSVIAIMENMSVHSRSKSLEAPIQEEEVIYTMVGKLFQTLLKARALSNMDIRRIGVRIAGLSRRKSQKPLRDFFPAISD